MPHLAELGHLNGQLRWGSISIFFFSNVVSLDNVRREEKTFVRARIRTRVARLPGDRITMFFSFLALPANDPLSECC